MHPPTAVFELSPRAYPSRLPSLEYADGMLTRRVQADGKFSWKHRDVFLGEALGGEVIGLEPIDGQYYVVYYSTYALALLDSASRRVLNGCQARRVAERLLGLGAPCAALRELRGPATHRKKV